MKRAFDKSAAKKNELFLKASEAATKSTFRSISPPVPLRHPPALVWLWRKYFNYF
ncbi:MAG: hypothetical protein KAG97_10255 [Victivallales bacterium]|nr:hypothetical protein [Victivallales bacterium]